MRSLDEIRQELDQVDRDLVGLFEHRMALAREVARWKQAHRLPVLDASREAQVLESRRAMLHDPHLDSACDELFRCLMSLSREEQASCLKEMTFDA